MPDSHTPKFLELQKQQPKEINANVGGFVRAWAAVTVAFFVPISVEDGAWRPFAVIGGLGAFAGLAASFVWGRHRAKLREIGNPAPTRQANPIHELLH